MVEAVRMLLLSGRIQIFVFSKQNVWNGPEKSHRTADLEPLRDMAKQAVASGLLWLKSFCGSVWPKSNTMYSLIYWFCVHWEMMMNQSNAFCHSTIYCTEKIFPCIYGNFWVFQCFELKKPSRKCEREWRYCSQQCAFNIPSFSTYTFDLSITLVFLRCKKFAPELNCWFWLTSRQAIMQETIAIGHHWFVPCETKCFSKKVQTLDNKRMQINQKFKHLQGCQNIAKACILNQCFPLKHIQNQRPTNI